MSHAFEGENKMQPLTWEGGTKGKLSEICILQHKKKYSTVKAMN